MPLLTILPFPPHINNHYTNDTILQPGPVCCWQDGPTKKRTLSMYGVRTKLFASLTRRNTVGTKKKLEQALRTNKQPTHSNPVS